jgi:hypothetical protein
MPIFNKDGSQFKLHGINPLMKNQDHWRNSVVKVHGFDSIEEIVLKDPMLAIDGHIDDDTPVAAVAGVGVIKDTTLIYCLPMIFREIEDEVYNEKRKVPDYGDKFTFEAVQVEFNGIAITFFCNLPPEKVPMSGSILHVWKERQWWKLNNSSREGDGVYLFCVPSDQHPSFV